jgi:hypothetical protein
MTAKADQQPDAWRPFAKPPPEAPALNLEARAKAFLDRFAPLAEANSWEFISGAVYAPILINSKSMSSKYWLIPLEFREPQIFSF